MVVGAAEMDFPPWLPFLINYGVISVSIGLLAFAAHFSLPAFRAWYAQPINKFWLVWITLVVGSGGMVRARAIRGRCCMTSCHTCAQDLPARTPRERR